MTYTVATLPVPAAVYTWIEKKLREAGYDHAIHGEMIDMTHIGLVPIPEPVSPPVEMTQHEEEVLRILNGETIAGWSSGAAMNACCSWLQAHGYATGSYQITQKGRDYLTARGF